MDLGEIIEKVIQRRRRDEPSTEGAQLADISGSVWAETFHWTVIVLKTDLPEIICKYNIPAEFHLRADAVDESNNGMYVSVLVLKKYDGGGSSVAL